MHHARPSLPRHRGARLVQLSAGQGQFGQAKIQDLDEPIVRNHQVIGLQVPMRDARLMRFGQTFRRLRRNFNCFLDGQRAGGNQLAHGLAFDQFHRDVVSGTIASEFVDGNDIGMIESGCRAGLLLEAPQAIAVSGESGRQNLDRNPAVQARILRPVHLAHPARAKEGDDLVGPEPRARGESHFVNDYIPSEASHEKQGVPHFSHLLREMGKSDVSASP